MPDTNAPATSAPAVSVVVPVRNEADNVRPLTDEIAAALNGRWSYELIYVNDGSTDATESVLNALKADPPWLRQITRAASCGQSAAVRSGVIAARASVVATLDGDGQNDPSFIPALLHAFEQGGRQIGLVAGQRVGRRSGAWKRVQSRIANGVRGAILRDGTRDSGCGPKGVPREAFLAPPYFDALPRLLPGLVQRGGFTIAHFEVVHRPRQ